MPAAPPSGILHQDLQRDLSCGSRTLEFCFQGKHELVRMAGHASLSLRAVTSVGPGESGNASWSGSSKEMEALGERTREEAV